MSTFFISNFFEIFYQNKILAPYYERSVFLEQYLERFCGASEGTYILKAGLNDRLVVHDANSDVFS